MRKLALVALVLAACNPFKEGSVAGRIESKGTAMGSWVLDKGSCFSGQREQYFGAIAHGPEGSGVAIKLVKDSIKGWSAVVNVPDTCKQAAADCKAIVLTAADCTKLDVEISPTNTTVNDIKVVEGRLVADCADTNGNSLKGELTLSYCH